MHPLKHPCHLEFSNPNPTVAFLHPSPLDTNQRSPATTTPAPHIAAHQNQRTSADTNVMKDCTTADTNVMQIPWYTGISIAL